MRDWPQTIPDGAEVVLGFDGSYSGDATAIVAVQIGDVPHLDLVRLWENPGTQVPIVDVEDALREACKRWRVQTIVADPFRWARSLQLLADEGLPVEEFPQSPQRMTPATQRFGEAVLNRALTHSGDPDLARHVGNAVVKNDSRGHRIVKEHKDSTRRIDLAVAAVMAFAAASTVETGAAVVRVRRGGCLLSYYPKNHRRRRGLRSTSCPSASGSVRIPSKSLHPPGCACEATDARRSCTRISPWLVMVLRPPALSRVACTQPQLGHTQLLRPEKRAGPVSPSGLLAGPIGRVWADSCPGRVRRPGR